MDFLVHRDRKNFLHLPWDFDRKPGGGSVRHVFHTGFAEPFGGSIMSDVQIPEDRDVVCGLAVDILKKNAQLSRDHGVTVPKKFLQELRKRAKKTANVLRKVEALRKKADELSHGVDADVTAVEKALREVAQSVIRQAGVEAAKKWGFAFTAGRSAKKPTEK
jgi:TATA-binding protein-associated factor Taf7